MFKKIMSVFLAVAVLVVVVFLLRDCFGGVSYSMDTNTILDSPIPTPIAYEDPEYYPGDEWVQLVLNTEFNVIDANGFAVDWYRAGDINYTQVVSAPWGIPTNNMLMVGGDVTATVYIWTDFDISGCERWRGLVVQFEAGVIDNLDLGEPYLTTSQGGLYWYDGVSFGLINNNLWEFHDYDSNPFGIAWVYNSQIWNEFDMYDADYGRIWMSTYLSAYRDVEYYYDNFRVWCIPEYAGHIFLPMTVK